MTTQGWPSVERTDVAQQGFELTLDEYVRQMEAAKRPFCSETQVRTPAESRHVDAINRNLAWWARDRVKKL